MRTKSLRALLFAWAGALGCTSSGSEDAGAELGIGSGSLALVRLERFAQHEDGAPRVVVNAKVARYSAMDGSSVLKLLGADVRDSESCTVANRLDDFALAPDARVKLLSVGQISLRAGELSQTFSPQLFPDLAPTASGWFYAGNAELPSLELDEYVLSAQGEQGVGRFEIAVAAPGAVAGMELGGRSLEQDGLLARASDVELTWEPEDLRDRLELELSAGASVLSCVLRDDGQAALPQHKLASLEPDGQASLVVRRVRVIPADMQGIETAYVRVASTRALPLRVE